MGVLTGVEGLLDGYTGSVRPLRPKQQAKWEMGNYGKCSGFKTAH